MSVSVQCLLFLSLRRPSTLPRACPQGTGAQPALRRLRLRVRWCSPINGKRPSGFLILSTPILSPQPPSNRRRPLHTADRCTSTFYFHVSYIFTRLPHTFLHLLHFFTCASPNHFQSLFASTAFSVPLHKTSSHLSSPAFSDKDWDCLVYGVIGVSESGQQQEPIFSLFSSLHFPAFPQICFHVPSLLQEHWTLLLNLRLPLGPRMAGETRSLSIGEAPALVAFVGMRPCR